MAELVHFPNVHSDLIHLITLHNWCSLIDGSPLLEGELLEYLDYVLFMDVTSGPGIWTVTYYILNKYFLNDLVSNQMKFPYL
jgi:hypothetical protein